MATAAVSPFDAGRSARIWRAAPDDRLVARVRRGDQGGFEAIYDRYHQRLLSFCTHMLGTREEAEDALQHVFLSAYRQLRADDRPIQLKSWLYTIARNRCLSMLRARRESDLLRDDKHAAAGPGVAAAVEHRHDLQELLADVSRLPEDQRAALLLAELGDLSHGEIAMTLGVRKEKVKALVFQAREALINARLARNADCLEIQQQLATMRGGALRRVTIRRHVADCRACATFRDEVAHQRAALAAVLPVVPSLALKHSVLSAVFGANASGALGASGAAAAAGGVGGHVVAASGAGIGASATSVKVVAFVALLGATGGGIAIVHRAGSHPAPAHHARPVRPAAAVRHAPAAPRAVVVPVSGPRLLQTPGRALEPARTGSSSGRRPAGRPATRTHRRHPVTAPRPQTVHPLASPIYADTTVGTPFAAPRVSRPDSPANHGAARAGHASGRSGHANPHADRSHGVTSGAHGGSAHHAPSLHAKGKPKADPAGQADHGHGAGPPSGKPAVATAPGNGSAHRAARPRDASASRSRPAASGAPPRQ